LMVQSLLADRFNLVVHVERKPMNVFALVAAKGGIKIEKSADSGKADCTRIVTADPAAGIRAEATCKNMTMSDLGRMLQAFAPGYADREVVDATALEGSYDFKLSWVARATVEQQGGLTIPIALERQLGLKLEERKIPVSVIVIDRIEKPSVN